jgi:hypothetical protein
MNCYVAIVRRSDAVAIPTAESLEPYLVRKPSSAATWLSANGRFCVISFQVSASVPNTRLFIDNERALTFDGFPDISKPIEDPQAELGNTLFVELRDNPRTLHHRLSGEYSLVYVNGSKLNVSSSLGGSHAVYYTANKDLVAFANRGPLLLSLQSVSTDLSSDASSWLCFQGYVGSDLTPFESIRKLPLGATAEVDETLRLDIRVPTYRDIVDPRIQELFAEDPSAALEESCLETLGYVERVKAFYGSLPMRVRLSGGKDSRLVLAMLVKAGLITSSTSIMTRGTLYSPEVLAAQDVCSAIGFDRHEILRPPVTSDFEVSLQVLTNSLNYCEGNLSLYDFMGIEDRRELNVCGHQLVLRPGAYQGCRTTSLAEFIEDATVARFHDPWSLLRDEHRDHIRSDFARTFTRYEEEGAPLCELGDLFLLRDRLLNWAAVVNNADYYSGPLTNPLLLPEVFRFAFSLPLEVRGLEVPNFAWMRICEPRFAGIPFADDTWKPALFDKLRELRVDASGQARSITAYQSDRSFPNLSNPLLPSLKVGSFRMLQPLMRDLLNEHRDGMSEYLDTERLDRILGENLNPVLRELYCMMGVYTDLLLRAYGKALFHRDSNSSIAQELQDRSKSPQRCTVGSSGTDSENIVDRYEETITRHELCVATYVREVQRMRDDRLAKERPRSNRSHPEGFEGEFVVRLPATRVRQVRIDPIEASTGEFELRGAKLLIGEETTDVPFLDVGDYHNIINATVVESSSNHIRFRAVGGNRPWLALKGLSALDLSAAPTAELLVRLKTDRGRRITVYWDIGDGYNSRDCVRVDW